MKRCEIRLDGEALVKSPSYPGQKRLVKPLLGCELWLVDMVIPKRTLSNGLLFNPFGGSRYGIVMLLLQETLYWSYISRTDQEIDISVMDVALNH